MALSRGGDYRASDGSVCVRRWPVAVPAVSVVAVRGRGVRRVMAAMDGPGGGDQAGAEERGGEPCRSMPSGFPI